MSAKDKKIAKEDIEHIECKFVVYCPPVEPRGTDYHMVKELLHLKTGEKVPNIRMIPNYKFDFYTTKPAFQNHEQKKEWEQKDRLAKYTTTRSTMMYDIKRALQQPWKREEKRELFRSQYLYGADIQSTAVLKKQYMDNFKGEITKFSMAAFDTEKDMVKGTGEINMATISFGSRVYTAIHRTFFDGHADIMNRLHKAMDKYLSEYVKKRNITWEVELVDTPAEIVVRTMNKAHAWRPDFVAIWNINFDMPFMKETLEKAGIDPKYVFSDPGVRDEYKHFHYKQGPKQKKTASGKVTPIKPPAQWHTVYTPASFYFIDAMCAYKHIRIGKQEEPSYSLDYILNEKLGIRKLKFKEADHLAKADWHQFMQENYPFEYVIYNVFDCISMEELDEKTRDLQLTLPSMSSFSDFDQFKSQPRRRADDLHYFVQTLDHVIGTTSDEMAIEEDKYTLGLEDWIVTLPAHLVADNGLQCIAENPLIRTNIRVHVADLDVSASYPNGGAALNISKETTTKEMFRVQGIDEHTQRMNSINLSGGATNSMEWCTDMLKMPGLEAMLEAFCEEKGIEI